MMLALETSEIQALWEAQNFNSILKDFRLRSVEILNSLSIPNSTMESWRRVSLSNFKPKNFLSNSILAPNVRVNNVNVVLEKFENLDVKQQGYCLEVLQQYQEKYKENYFAQLAFAFHSSMYYLELQENLELKDISLELSSSGLVEIPIFFIKQKKFSNNKVEMRYKFPETKEISFFNSVEIFIQEDSSELELIRTEDFANSVFHFANVFHSQARDSKSILHFYNLGGYKGKTFVYSELKEKGANAFLLGACATAKREQQDIEFTIYHNASYTESKLLYRAVANDKSHHIFTGILNIPNSSKHVSAEQINNNILFKKTARVESMPKLEVFADDVRCAHGSTIGEVEEEQLFYLLSRGLTESQAKHLIIEGFFSEVLDKMSSEALREELCFRLLKKLQV